MRSAMACMLSKNRQPTLFRHHYQRKTCTKPLSNIRIVSPLRVRVQARGHNNFTLRKPGLHHTRYTFPKTCHDGLQGYLAHKKHPSPRDRHRSLGIGLLTGPTGGVFLMSKVPLYVTCVRARVLEFDCCTGASVGLLLSAALLLSSLELSDTKVYEP